MSSEVTSNCDHGNLTDFNNYVRRIILRENSKIDELLIQKAGENCDRLFNLRRAAALLIHTGDTVMIEALTQDDKHFIVKILYPAIPRLGDILGSLLN
jgi:hypothetical protein